MEFVCQLSLTIGVLSQKKKSRAITDPAPVSLKASFVSRHYIGSLSHHPG